ncbi:hypothetical protein [Gemmatimonas sp.]|uniref:hypothetical protein n=1 Tax=Gemmatimonas sp. TaxID=1962908 RepID=UPI0025BFF7C9|nr:hypothetical protein [Gemmatimonas sp.]MCA2990297.1 hypothetical protein [Gemmatimonas sp.]
MPRHPVCFRCVAWRACLVGLALVGMACDRPRSPAGGDSAAPAENGVRPEPAALEGRVSGWDMAAGPFVVLPTVDGGMVAGSLLLPEAADSSVGDTTGVGALVGDARVELFSRGGRVSDARLAVELAPPGEAGCSAWPVARLAVDAGAAVPPWTAAFAAGRVTPIPLDSIEGLAPRDSARLAADLTRLASRLPDDTSATFRALPFVVLRAWRSRGVDSTFVVALLARRVNQEDDPKEERLVLVVDALGNTAATWRVGWHERASGHEEELVVAEPLLAFRATGSPDVRLLFGRDDGVALGAAVLARREGAWRVLWESAIAGCG